MRKLKIYKGGQRYVTGGFFSIQPLGVEPVEEHDLSSLSKKDFRQLKKNPSNKKLLKKARKIKRG